jgi:hypothetical protein
MRKQIQKRMKQTGGSQAESEQLAVLGDYALGVQTAVNLDGKLPFTYAGVEALDALDELATSLEEMEKKGVQ